MNIVGPMVLATTVLLQTEFLHQKLVKNFGKLRLQGRIRSPPLNPILGPRFTLIPFEEV